MKTHDTTSHHEWMDARVEAYVDDDLPTAERTTFEQMLDEYPYWQAQVRHARRIRDALHTLPDLTCPPQVTDAVLNETRRRTNGSQQAGWWIQLWRTLDAEWRTGWKPALAGLTLVLIVAISAIGIPVDRFDGAVSNAPSHYTQAEIQQAEAEAKWALAYVAQVGQKTGTTVEETVLEEGMAAPMRRALRPLTQADIDSDNPNR